MLRDVPVLGQLTVSKTASSRKGRTKPSRKLLDRGNYGLGHASEGTSPSRRREGERENSLFGNGKSSASVPVWQSVAAFGSLDIILSIDRRAHHVHPVQMGTRPMMAPSAIAALPAKPTQSTSAANTKKTARARQLLIRQALSLSLQNLLAPLCCPFKVAVKAEGNFVHVICKAYRPAVITGANSLEAY